ncbi:MAG: ATP-binding protein [Chitinivibrionia bacterium]|nr:ATP-binding protein [Chitinivibrionia bacterium]
MCEKFDFPRDMTANIEKFAKHFPIILITGARQVGKSTLVKTLKNFNYITFDDISFISLAQNDPVRFIDDLKTPSILDEVQRVPDLLIAIKKSVDENRSAGRFILTGSADVIKLKKVKETLAGRVVLAQLPPLSQKEIRNKKPLSLETLHNHPRDLELNDTITRDKIINAIIVGGYPERNKITDNDMRKSWTDSYISTYIQQDIQNINEIRNINSFFTLFNILPPLSATLISKQKLASDVKISAPTIDNYLELLTQIYQITWLPSWSSKIGKQFIKNSKMYFTDTGLLTHILRIFSVEQYKNSSFCGNIFETFVLAELRKAINNQLSDDKIFYMRTSDGKEVDFIIESEHRPLAIEVKFSETIRFDDFKHIMFLQDKRPEFQGIIFYTGNKIIPFGDNCTAVPVSALF